MTRKTSLKDFISIGAKAFVARLVSALALILLWFILLIPVTFAVGEIDPLSLNPALFILVIIIAIVTNFAVEGFVLNRLYRWD